MDLNIEVLSTSTMSAPPWVLQSDLILDVNHSGLKQPDRTDRDRRVE